MNGIYLILLDSEVLDEFVELIALLQLNNQLGLLSSSWLVILSFFCGIRDDSSSFDSVNSSVSVSAEEFTNLNTSADGISESMKFNIIEVHQEKLGEKDVETGVSLSGDLNFVGCRLDLLGGFVG
jgi:hypothetical protein